MTIVPVQRVSVQVRYKQVGIAVVIVVGARHAKAIPRIAEAGLSRDICERSVAIVPVQHIAHRTWLVVTRERSSLHEEHIKKAIAVIVQQRDTRAKLLWI